jgi:hypothetical protein
MMMKSRACCLAVLLVTVQVRGAAAAGTVDERQRAPLTPQATASLLLDVFTKGITGNSPLLLRRVLADTVSLNDAPLARSAAATTILGSLAGTREASEQVFPTNPRFGITFSTPDTAVATLADAPQIADTAVGAVAPSSSRLHTIISEWQRERAEAGASSEDLP